MVDVVLPLDQSDNALIQRQYVARKLHVPIDSILELRLRKRSIDARKREIKVRLRFAVGLTNQPLCEEPPLIADYPNVPSHAPRAIVVGSGPSGLFAALQLIELGIRPIVLERGKDVSARRFDLAPILREGRVIEDSNYCFGEGGAGTFSDGKLYTRATKRGPVAKIYQTLVSHGAPERIMIDAHPHVGSNLLPKVIRAIRHSIIGAGGEVRFSTKVKDLLLRDGEVQGVATSQGEHITADAVILATGHSARDIYRMLHAHALHLEPKPFAVGVRIEHPQALIDAQQYHYPRGAERPALLPAASYRLATKIKERGVHSFCMCPGGFIVPAATEDDEVVVNGMSLSRRDSPFANSGLVVTVEPEDAQTWMQSDSVLTGIDLQKQLEKTAKSLGGGGQTAPAQAVGDFLRGKNSPEPLASSYFPGLACAPLHETLPPDIVWRMQQGLELFARQIPGFTGQEAQLVGVETRTSSPIRIPRHPHTMEHGEVGRLYPCGEGAGYAGGIVSAALDGLKVAEAVAQRLGQAMQFTKND